MKLSSAALCAMFALACGSGSKPAKPGVTPGGGDAAPPTPEASADLGVEVAAHPDAGVQAAPDTGAAALPEVGVTDGRAEGPPPLVITVAGECGSPSGPRCPVAYKGTSTISLETNRGFTAAMAPDEALYLGGGFNMPLDFDPTAGVDMRTPQSADAFLTSLTATGGYGFTDTFPVENAFQGAGIYSLSIGASAVVASGSFDSKIDLDPGPNADTHESVGGGRAGSFIAKLTRGGALVWSRAVLETDGSLVSLGRAALAADGGVYLSGGFAQSTQDDVVLDPVDLDPGPGKRTSPDQRGTFLMRLDAKGNTQWIRMFGGSGCEFVAVDGTVVTADGGAVYVGAYQGSCSLDQGGPGFIGVPTGMYLLSLGPDGKVRAFGDIAGSVQPVVVALAPDGKVVIGGSASPPEGGPTAIDFDPSSAVGKLAVPTQGGTFLMALDAALKLSWAQVLPDMNLVSLSPLSDNGLLLAGAPIRTTSPAIVIVRLGADRHEAWRFTAGNLSTMPYGIFAGAKGFTLVGTTNNPGSDLDPSAGVDRIAGEQLFLSRYAF